VCVFTKHCIKIDSLPSTNGSCSGLAIVANIFEAWEQIFKNDYYGFKKGFIDILKSSF